VLVTGASGFLGRYTVRGLAAAGYTVVGLGRTAPPIDASMGLFRYQQIDLADPSCVEMLPRAVGDHCRAVAHLAAIFPASLTSPDAVECGRQNLRMDAHIVQVCERLHIPLVYASTASVYSTDTMTDKREDGPTVDSHPYAREKLATERDAGQRLAETGTPFTALRITAPYGAGQVRRTVVRIFLDRALQGQPLLYHGTGAREQDFVHASDVADAVRSAIERAATGIFNIGSGVPVTMKELAALVVGAVPECQSSVQPSGVPDPEEVRYARIPVTKAAAQLAWKPRITLADGLGQWASSIASQPSHAGRASV